MKFFKKTIAVFFAFISSYSNAYPDTFTIIDALEIKSVLLTMDDVNQPLSNVQVVSVSYIDTNNQTRTINLYHCTENDWGAWANELCVQNYEIYKSYLTMLLTAEATGQKMTFHSNMNSIIKLKISKY